MSNLVALVLPIPAGFIEKALLVQKGNAMNRSTLLMVSMLTAICLSITTLAARADGYNKRNAVIYARMYANNYNWRYTSYPENDCANFISQALKEGGWTYRYNGYDSMNSWYYETSGFKRQCRSWVNAHYLFNFVRNQKRGDEIGQGVNSNRGRYNDLEPGDLVFADWYKAGGKAGEDGLIDHVYIVTGKDSRGILLSSHTTNRLDIPMKDVFQNFELGQKGRFYYVRLKTQY
jgi:hypothetical protein